MIKNSKSLGIPPQLSKAFNRAMKVGPNIPMSKGRVNPALNTNIMPGSKNIPQMGMGVPNRQQPKGISIKCPTKRIF